MDTSKETDLHAECGGDLLKWAGAFDERFQVFRRRDSEQMDAGLMIGWFSNVITAYEQAQAK